MKIHLDQVAGHLGLEFLAPLILSVVLENIHEGIGSIEIESDSTYLNNIAIKETSLKMAPLTLHETNITTSEVLSVCDAHVDMRVGAKTSGSARIKNLRCPSISIKQPRFSIQFQSEHRDLALNIDENTSVLDLGAAQISQCVFNSNDLAGIAKNIRIENLKITFSSKDVSIESELVSCESVELKLPSRKFVLKNIRLEKGFQFSNKALTLPGISVDTYEVVLDRIFAAEQQSPSTKNKSNTIQVQFSPQFLDGLSGNFNTDLKVKATVPVIGKRRATHRFRIPIVDGVINFKTLEESLSDLENAFIDLNLRGNALVLERDIPLIPGFEKPIVSWEIQEENLGLAKANKIKISNLLAPKLAESKKSGEEKGKSKLKLHRLDFEDIDVTLRSSIIPLLISQGIGTLCLGFDLANAKGRMSHDKEQQTQMAATSLATVFQDLRAICDNFSPIQGLAISGELHFVSTHRIEATFHGVIPKAAFVQGKSIQGQGLQLKFQANKSA